LEARRASLFSSARRNRSSTDVVLSGEGFPNRFRYRCSIYTLSGASSTALAHDCPACRASSGSSPTREPSALGRGRGDSAFAGRSTAVFWFGFLFFVMRFASIYFIQGKGRPRHPHHSVPDPSTRSRPAVSANARKSRSRVRRGTPPSMQLWAISASPRRALRLFARTFARKAPALCQ
jgi:hypothetical protein